MKNFAVLMGSILLVGNGAFAAPLKSHSIGGSCSPTSKKEKVTCPTQDESDPPAEFTYYNFAVKENKKVKTTSTSCSDSLVTEIRIMNGDIPDPKVPKAPETADDKATKPLKYVPQACTLLTLSAGGPQLAIFEQKEFEKDLGGQVPDLLHRQILLVKVEKGQAQKIVEKMLSVDTLSESKNILNVHSLCDTDGDNQAEIVLNEEVYFSNGYLVYKIKSDAGEATKESFMSSGGCGC
ncbi:hypothetical protein [Bdellovibrio sp. HCB337]|uniref:hypothetical protein n=1 Tax=Bdellovibrio sp. HCB337 TaxID=3394358 RepID=UPI0039A5717D